MHVEDQGTSVVGRANGADLKIIKELRRGHPAPERHVDLHGLTRDKAQDRLFKFIDDAQAAGVRQVLVVVGRGHNSGPDGAVIRPMVLDALATALAPQIFAFTSAPPQLGGAGAF